MRAITILLNILLFLLRALGVLLLVLLAAAVLAVCLRVGAEAEKNENGVRVRVRYGPLRLTVYPLKKRAPKDKAAAPKKPPKPEKPKEPPGFDLSGLDVGETVCLALTLLEEMKDTLVIDRLCLSMTVAGTDAARTAQRYGTYMALAGMIYPFLTQNFVMKICRIEITPDFDHTQTTWSGEAACFMRPVRGLLALLRHRKALYRLYRQIQKDEAKQT